MLRNKILSSVIFFAVGAALFFFVYRNFNYTNLLSSLHQVKFRWIIVSVVFGLFSHFIRAIRWKLLINTLGYRPGNTNLFLSVLVLYFTNLIIPRGGEIARCGVLYRYESIPVVRLAGTVLAERISDLLTFLLILLVLVLWQFDFFRTVFASLHLNLSFTTMHNKILIGSIILITILVLLWGLKKLRIRIKAYTKVKKLENEFIEGIRVILRLKEKGKYLLYTLLIFFMWFLMLYVLFFAFAPTNKLSFTVAVLTYSFGNIAYLLPIQAGIGAWHFIVINCLFFFGIDRESGMIFALIAHTFTSLIFLIFGPIAMALLPLVNSPGTRSLQTKPLS